MCFAYVEPYFRKRLVLYLGRDQIFFLKFLESSALTLIPVTLE